MSWSVAADGPNEEVKAKINQQFSGGACLEPEESIRQKAKEIIALALDHQGHMPKVQVSAYGSQSTDYATKAVSNSLSITITPHS